ncbi:MGDG synthase family glycosyltransferase [Sulfobacillus harzensis]|uniref:Glycosyltransferase n=1 Tax=Sulfobacillus harzensis TaxID=2729629 RepID=A0A7Y0Q3V9_9FIRM|nr:glycosyltransferase [Sulfobacillus harzensis]NMP23401.1 glycosyltransferase [Sulfobacillus harzensis]
MPDSTVPDAMPTDNLAKWIDWLPQHHEATLASRPDIMILAARYGDGHLRAAKAIGLKVKLTHPALSLGILDYYKFVNSQLDNVIRWAYLSSVRFAPSLWKWFYTATQKIDSESTTQQFLNRIGIESFYRAIAPKPPKVIVSTYPTAAGVVSTLKRQGRLSALNYVVMTDYSIHSQWIHRHVDLYFVGGDDMKEALIERGVDSKRVVVSGIPVDSRFQEPVNEDNVRRQLGIGSEPILLFMGGSYMPIQEFSHILSQLDQVTVPHATVVVAGREENRRQVALEYQKGAQHPMVVLGYVNNVHELMGVSSILISKAGGLTTTEALCRGVPMLIYRPIPGQEDANAAYVVKHGAGFLAKDQNDVTEMVTHLLTHPWELKAMARQARLLGHPDAADVIAAKIYEGVSAAEAHAQ